MSILFTLALVLTVEQSDANAGHSYAAGQRVPIEFHLRKRDREGGRLTPFFTHYRPSIGSDRKAAKCEFHVPGGGGVAPGETRRIEMICPFPTQMGASIEFFELNRPVGRAQVLPPAP